MTAAAERVRADRAPKPGVRLTASTINDDQLDALYAERDRYAAAIARVRGLHQPTAGLGYIEGGGYDGIDPACTTCGTSDEYAVPYPCPTATALDGPSEARTAPTVALVSPVGLRDAPGAAGGLG